MFDVIGYDVIYTEGFVKSAFNDEYGSRRSDSYARRQTVFKSVKRGMMSVLMPSSDSCVILRSIKEGQNARYGWIVTGLHVCVIVKKDENRQQEMLKTLKEFESSFGWEEYLEGPHFELDPAFRSVESEEAMDALMRGE